MQLAPELADTLRKGVVLGCFLGTGKRKNERMFIVDLNASPPLVQWKKLSDKKVRKSMELQDIFDGPELPDGASLFDTMDRDRSGYLDEQEVANLYANTMGERLKKAALRSAMGVMDTDGNGRVSRAEFESWWERQGGSALEKARDRAFTLVTPTLPPVCLAPCRCSGRA